MNWRMPSFAPAPAVRAALSATLAVPAVKTTPAMLAASSPTETTISVTSITHIPVLWAQKRPQLVSCPEGQSPLPPFFQQAGCSCR